MVLKKLFRLHLARRIQKIILHPNEKEKRIHLYGRICFPVEFGSDRRQCPSCPLVVHVMQSLQRDRSVLQIFPSRSKGGHVPQLWSEFEIHRWHEGLRAQKTRRKIGNIFHVFESWRIQQSHSKLFFRNTALFEAAGVGMHQQIVHGRSKDILIWRQYFIRFLQKQRIFRIFHRARLEAQVEFFKIIFRWNMRQPRKSHRMFRQADTRRFLSGDVRFFCKP